MYFPTSNQSLLIASLFLSLYPLKANADFSIYKYQEYEYDCDGDVAHCEQILSGLGVTVAPSELGASCPSFDDATDKDTGDHCNGIQCIPGRTAEIWFNDGTCGSDAPYYCYVDPISFQWTCNGNQGQQVMNCKNATETESSVPHNCKVNMDDPINTDNDDFFLVASCTGPISC